MRTPAQVNLGGLRFLAVPLFCLIWGIGPSPVEAQINRAGGGWNVELVSQIGGGALRDVELEGDLAFVAEHLNLSIIDASNPAALAPVGRVYLGEMILDVAVDGGTAVATDNRRNLHLIDVSNPARPVQRSILDSGTEDNVLGLASNLLFAGAHSFDGGIQKSFLLTYDVSDLSSATLLSSWEAPGFLYGLHVSGERLYLAGDGIELRIFSFADPTSLTLIGQYDTGDNGRRVFVRDERAYLATSGQPSLKILDVSDPTSPTLLGTKTMITLPAGVAASAGRLFLSHESIYGLEIIDVADPSTPTTRAFYRPIDGTYYSPKSSGTLAWVPNSMGLDIVDTSNATSPSVVGLHRLPREVPAYDVADGKASFITHRVGAPPGLAVMDFSNPRLPAHQAWWPVGSSQATLAAGSDTVFLSTPEGLRVVDFRDRLNSVVTGPFGFGGIPRETYSAAGSEYLLTSTGSGLGVIDVTDLNAPTTAGLAPVGPNPDFAVAGDRVYTLSEGQLSVVGVSDPTSPVLLGSSNVALSDHARLCVNNDLVYVTDDTFLRICDAGNPAAISKVVDFSLLAPSEWVSPVLLADVLYVPHPFSALVDLVDVSDPTSPTLCGFSSHAASGTSGDYIRELRLAGDAVTVPTAKGGIWTIRYIGPPPTAVEPRGWRSYR